MCSIVASYRKDKLEELIDLNQFRGSFSFSYTEVDEKTVPVCQLKDFGEFNKAVISENNYKIGHVQAPTGGLVKDVNRIHPVERHGSMLWHNGLLTPRGIKFLQEKLGTDESFDTKLMFDAIMEFGFNILSEVEGLFSCLLLHNRMLYMFRTKHGKLYIDDDFNISSERFEGSKCINYNTVYYVDLENEQLVELDKFETKRFNFVVPGEL